MAKLMLVEDDNNLREIYEARLQAEGYTIVSARDGEEALVVAKAEKPDLIISDVMMPKISGFEMLDILRNTEGLKEVKVIMLTALGQNDDQQRADRLGADRYLVKSQVTLEDIVKVAHDLLQDAPGAAASDTPAPATAPATPPPTAEPVAPKPTNIPVAAEPAAPAPEPTPVAAEPAPAPAPEPPVVPAPATPLAVAEPAAPTPAATDQKAADNVASTDPQSEANESAEVEAGIENFVAGATEDATPPPAAPSITLAEPAAPAPEPTPVAAEPAPAPAPEPPVVPAPATPPPAVEPATEPAAPTPAATDQKAADNVASATVDDKLIKDAAQALTDSAAAANQPVVTESAAAAPAEPAPGAAIPTDIDAPATPTDANSENVTIAHKKVIAPPAASNKKDIGALLAEEEAKEGGVIIPPTVVTGDGSAKPSTDAGDGKVDPHSIAL